MSFYDDELILLRDKAIQKVKDFVLGSGWQMEYDLQHYPIVFKYVDGQMEIGDTSPKPLQIVFVIGTETEIDIYAPPGERLSLGFFNKLKKLTETTAELFFKAYFMQRMYDQEMLVEQYQKMGSLGGEENAN